MSIEAFVKKNNGKTNYDLMKDRAAQLISSCDVEKAVRRFNLQSDEEYIYLRLFDLSCRVRRKDGFAEYADGNSFREADFGTAMILYDLLGY